MPLTRSQLMALVKRDIYSRIYLAQHGTPRTPFMDSFGSMNRRLRRKVERLADAAIVRYDRRHNDFVGLVLFKNIFIYMILPFLIDFIKGAVAGGISASVKQKFIDPILDRLIGSGKRLLERRGDEAYTQAIVRNIKSDMGILCDRLRKEGSYVAGKVTGLFNKIKNIVV